LADANRSIPAIGSVRQMQLAQRQERATPRNGLTKMNLELTTWEHVVKNGIPMTIAARHESRLHFYLINSRIALPDLFEQSSKLSPTKSPSQAERKIGRKRAFVLEKLPCRLL
jgi:hypothetical protein